MFDLLLDGSAHDNRFFFFIVNSSLSKSSLSVERFFEAVEDVGKSPPKRKINKNKKLL